MTSTELRGADPPSRGAGTANQRRGFLHLGTMKSGTTFVQHMLAHYQDDIAADGVLFPGGGRYINQINGVRDILRLPGATNLQQIDGAWAALVDEIATSRLNTFIVSEEHLSVAPPRGVAKVVGSLAPSSVDVILTVRDLARVLPSTWQENIQNGLTWSWREFTASVRREPGADPAAGERFWRQHDVPTILRRWSRVVGPEHVHLVTVPRSGAPRDLLWRRFCEVVDLEPDRYPVDGAPLRSNKGLDRAAAETLRRVNKRLGASFDVAARQRVVKRGLAKTTLAEEAALLPITLDNDQYEWTVERSNDLVEEVRGLGIRVVGDLDELVPLPRDPVDVAETREPTDAEIASVAATAVVALLERLAPGPAAPAKRRQRLGARR